MNMYYTNYKSVIGNLTLISDGNYLLEITGEVYRFNSYNESYIRKDNLEVFIKVKKWLDKYFNKELIEYEDINILLIGTTFQKEVWEEIKNIPYGTLITYSDIAKKIAKRRNIKRMSSQAVGNAVGKNPISILIPCHRVIGVNNNLVGYGGGIDTKIKLLNLENIDTTKLKKPKQR